MNSTTTTTVYSNTTITYYVDFLISYFTSPDITIRFYQIGYPITFLLGFIGNTASLITFSRSTLRKVSTGCLFIILAISDILYLLMCIFDFVEIGLQVRFYGYIKYDELCRFRSFILNVSQVLSSWTLVTISVDRWIRTRFPYKSGSLCTPKKVLIVISVILIIDIGLHGHILSPLFGRLIPGFAILSCGSMLKYRAYFSFYFYQWTVIQILVVCLVPAILMLLILMDIFISVRIRKRAIIQPAPLPNGNNRTNHQKALQLQMFILMLTSACIFLVTTLPLAIYKITSPRQDGINKLIYQITIIWTGLGWFQSLNYAINFYSHCLTSTLFRNEFRQQLNTIFCIQQTRVEVFNLTRIDHRTQFSRRQIGHDSREINKRN